MARSASQPGAAAPSTIAAVVAVLASTHEAAATDAVRQTGTTGSPVRGSTTFARSNGRYFGCSSGLIDFHACKALRRPSWWNFD